MSDLPPFDPPYQPVSAELGRALQEFENSPKGQAGGANGKKDKASFLVVPFAQKDEAKALGAKWDATARKWYVPEGKDKEVFKRWLPPV